MYLPLFTLKYVYFVSLSIYCRRSALFMAVPLRWVHRNNWCYQSILGRWAINVHDFWNTNQFFSQVFPIFRNPLGIIFYCWQVIIILCCCICPRLATSYHTCSFQPFWTAILRQVRINNIACRVPKQMVQAYNFPHPYLRCNCPHSTFFDGLGQVSVDNIAYGALKQMVWA